MKLYQFLRSVPNYSALIVLPYDRCFSFPDRLGIFRLEVDRFCTTVLAVRIFREQGNERILLFTVGMFLTGIVVPFCQTIFIPVSVFRGHFSLIGIVQIMVNAFPLAKIVLGYVYYLPKPFYDRFTQAHKL